MRKWRPPDVSAEDEWTVNHHIVVPITAITLTQKTVGRPSADLSADYR